MDKLLQAMSEYEHKIGLKNKVVPNPIDSYLNMSREDMRKLSQQDCREIALCLYQYSVFIQRCYNEKINEGNFLKNELDRAIVSEMQQVQAPTTDERRLLAIRNNDVARRLESEKNKCYFEANQIFGLSNIIKETAKAFEQLGWSRKNG